MGSDWVLLFEGTNSGNSIALGYMLIQYGSQLFLNTNTSRTDICTGHDCAGCELRHDGLGRPYCNCFMPNPGQPKCDHTTSGSAAGFIDALDNCLL